MVYKAREMLSMALLGAVLAFSAVARAQAPPLNSSGPRSIMRFASTRSDTQNDGEEVIPLPSPADMLTAEGDEEDEFRKSLPRPPIQPKSLFDPAPPVAPGPDLERPFFQADPILDPLQWQRPGWFANVDVAVIKPHVTNEMLENVTTGSGKMFAVQPGSAASQLVRCPASRGRLSPALGLRRDLTFRSVLSDAGNGPGLGPRRTGDANNSLFGEFQRP